MSHTDMKMLNTLGMGLRLTISEIHRIVAKEKDLADKEALKKNGRGFIKKPTGMF